MSLLVGGKLEALHVLLQYLQHAREFTRQRLALFAIGFRAKSPQQLVQIRQTCRPRRAFRPLLQPGAFQQAVDILAQVTLQHSGERADRHLRQQDADGFRSLIAPVNLAQQGEVHRRRLQALIETGLKLLLQTLCRTLECSSMITVLD